MKTLKFQEAHVARGSRRIHTLGGLDFQALSPHRLLGSVGEVATGGGGVQALPVGERVQEGWECQPGPAGGLAGVLGSPLPPRPSGGGRLEALPHGAMAAMGSRSA